MRLLLSILVAVLAATACGGSSEAEPVPVAPATAAPATVPPVEQAAPESGPGGYGFDRSDPEAGVANIMEAFATDEATATCVFDAWGDVANVPPEELTTELMTYEICGTSILRMITGTG